jgi:hypothetical protein
MYGSTSIAARPEGLPLFHRAATALLMLSLTGVSTEALAAGHYDPNEVAARSAQFTRAAEAMAPAFEQAESAASGLAGGLRAWEEAIDLLGARAPAGERAALDAAEGEFFRQRAVLAAFATRQAEDFDALFREAIERATAGDDLAPCSARSGLRLGPSRGGERVCAGADKTDDVVRQIDADRVLVAGIDQLLGAPWPTIKLDVARLPALMAPPVFVGELLHRAAGDQLQAIDRADAEARVPFEAAIEEGASPAQLAALRDEAAAVDAATASRRAALAAPLLAAVDAARAKAAKRGDMLPDLCVRPDVFGGCGGPSSPAGLGELLADPKVAAAVRKVTRP